MIKKLGTLFISYFVLLQFTNVRASNPYCTFDCKDPSYPVQGHPMCIYKQSGPGPKCPADARPGVTEEEKQLIVNLHNQLRQQVARGQEFRGNPGPQPAAAFMPNLEWDNELQMIAQRWADQCIYGHACAAVDRFHVGQNVVKYPFSNEPGLAGIEMMVKLWYDEVAIFNSQMVSAYRFDMDYGHYSQMVWAKTTKIGCGINRYQEYIDGYNYNVIYLVCNYGPSGNYENEPVY